MLFGNRSIAVGKDDEGVVVAVLVVVVENYLKIGAAITHEFELCFFAGLVEAQHLFFYRTVELYDISSLYAELEEVGNRRPLPKVRPQHRWLRQVVLVATGCHLSLFISTFV